MTYPSYHCKRCPHIWTARKKGEEALDYSKESKFDWKTVADKVLGVIYKANENKINVLFNIANERTSQP